MNNAFDDIESTLLNQPLTPLTINNSNSRTELNGEESIPISGSSRHAPTQKTADQQHQHWCFQQRTSILAIIITITIVAAITVVLNISLAILSAKNHNIPFNAEYKSGESYFIMDGIKLVSNDNFYKMPMTMPIFENIPYNIPISHLELINVEVNPTLLFRSIQQHIHAKKTLKSIRLINVTLIGTFNTKRQQQQELILPNLKEFTLEINQQIGPFELLRLGQNNNNRNCTVNIFDIQSRHIFSNFHDPSCIKSFIFFRKPNMDRKWPISKIHQLNTKIDIIIFGFHIFSWNPDKQELVSLLHSSTEILDDITRTGTETETNNNNVVTMKGIHLRDVPLKLTTLLYFATQVTYLTLIDIDFIHDVNNSLTISTVLSQFEVLEYLDLEHHFPYTINAPKLNINLNLLSKAGNLKSLSISLAKLELNQMERLPRFSLNHLELYEFGLENIQILNQFHVIFNGTKSIFWHGELIQTSMKFSRINFWIAVMKITSLELVIFGNPSTILGGKLPTHNETIQIEANNLLRDLGLNEDEVNLDTSFAISKDKKSGKWNGRNYKEYNTALEAMANKSRLRVGWNLFTSNETHSEHLRNEYNKFRLHCNV